MKFVSKPAIRICVFYLLLVVLWIFVSDQYLLNVAGTLTPGQNTLLQTIKEVSFAVIIAVFIYVIVYRSNKKLSDSDEEYQQLFLNNPNPMWIYDLETMAFLKVNRAAVDKYGYSEKEFLSMTLKDIRDSGELSGLTNYLKSLTDKLSETRVWKHRKKNGQPMIVQATNHFIHFRKRRCRLAVCYDITDKSQLEQSLLKSNTALNMLVNSITDGFYIINKDFTILKHNMKLSAISGRHNDELEGKNLFEVFPESFNQIPHQQYVKALTTNQSVYFETYNPSLGTWFRVSAYPFENGLSVFFRDITKEKEDDSKIIQNEQNLSALINNTEDLIWSIDSNFAYYTFNKQYKTQYYSFFKEDIWPGKSALIDKKGTCDSKGCRTYYEKALAGERFSIEMEFQHPGGGKRHANIRFNPIYDAGNKVVGVGCLLQDVTQSVNHLNKIERQNTKLRHIAYIISHTVRAPLANILGLAAAINRNNISSTNDLKYLEYIDYSARQLDDIIKDIVNQTVQVEEGSQV